jgi:hypothetical protein
MRLIHQNKKINKKYLNLKKIYNFDQVPITIAHDYKPGTNPSDNDDIDNFYFYFTAVILSLF